MTKKKVYEKNRFRYSKKFKVTAIRNKSLGKWAAEKLGLENSKIDDYIDEVIMADFNEERCNKENFR